MVVFNFLALKSWFALVVSMALYNLAFYRIYHLIFGQKRYFFIQLQKRQNVRDRISSYAYLLAMELDYLTTTTCE